MFVVEDTDDKLCEENGRSVVQNLQTETQFAHSCRDVLFIRCLHLAAEHLLPKMSHFALLDSIDQRSIIVCEELFLQRCNVLGNQLVSTIIVVHLTDDFLEVLVNCFKAMILEKILSLEHLDHTEECIQLFRVQSSVLIDQRLLLLEAKLCELVAARRKE